MENPTRQTTASEELPKDKDSPPVCEECGREKYLQNFDEFYMKGIGKVWLCKGGCSARIRKIQEVLLQRNREKPEISLNQAGVPRKYWSCSFETFTGNPRLVEACLKHDISRQGMVLTGNCGCGKTHLGVSFMRKQLQNVTDIIGFKAAFLSPRDLISKISRTMGRQSQDDLTESEIIEKYGNVDLLLLDDLGADSSNAWFASKVYALVDTRYCKDKPTIVTTNLTLDEIGKRLDDRIASRLAESRTIGIDMPDFRKNRRGDHGK